MDVELVEPKNLISGCTMESQLGLFESSILLQMLQEVLEHEVDGEITDPQVQAVTNGLMVVQIKAFNMGLHLVKISGVHFTQVQCMSTPKTPVPVPET